jgi:hypothetical protein
MKQVTIPEIIGRIRTHRNYFAHSAKEEPLFLPELRVANEILALIDGGSVDEAVRNKVERALNGLTERHCDGTGWHGFKNDVRFWLERTGSSR